MNCYYCGAPLDRSGFCPSCYADVRLWKKINAVSNRLYNDALEKAQVRDLTGAAAQLKLSLRYNKMNMNARNLLGLIYYELGETVNALSEWVISKSLIPNENPAESYLARVQKSALQLENINQTIKKFNTALNYCKTDNCDLAVIQLKKVLALNPRMVKGHQLLALLYMKQERYDLAMRSLRMADKVDANNTDTLRYKQECRAYLKANGKLKPKKEEDDIVTYQSGNDIIIRPAKFTDNTAVRTVVNLLLGAAIGIAVVWFLLIPEIRQNANAEANTQVIEANQTISAKDHQIQGLEEEIKSLNKKVTNAQKATDTAEEKTASYSKLLDAYADFADKKYTEAAKKMPSVKRDLLDEDAQKIYDSMLDKVQTAILQNTMEEAMKLYEAKNYPEAIEKLLTIMETDEGYENGKAAFFLAFAYVYEEDEPNALKWFKVTVQNTNSGHMKSTSQEMIEDMEAREVEAAQ